MILVPEWDRPPGPAGLDKGCRSGKPPDTRPARPKLSSGRLSCPLASETWGSSYRPASGPGIPPPTGVGMARSGPDPWNLSDTCGMVDSGFRGSGLEYRGPDDGNYRVGRGDGAGRPGRVGRTDEADGRLPTPGPPG